ncbi:MAG: zinc transport system substrate-binding protein [Actinomycetota bacterium]|jgi:zinc transport system substrate-binding protein|nr:zinc transport system substrate-binding protein [Actinomycetota bacterium]
MQTKLITALCLTLLCSACSQGGSEPNDKLKVVAAFYPLAWATEQVGGASVEVEDLTPSGVEPHDLELKASQVRDISEADLVVYMGSGFQPAVDDVAGQLDESQRLDALEGRDLLHGTPEEGEADASQIDPHVWLDPSIMATIVDDVAVRLAEIDPDNADRFRANSSALQDELAALDEEFRTGLSGCKRNEIVTSHAAFAYLAARYKLDQVSVAGIDPESEPSPGRLAEVARFVTENDVTTIFFEELAPKDVADTLARETGAKVEVLSPLETKPEAGDYLDAMRTNLTALRDALDCE